MILEHYIIWIALGFFICYKRNWYKHNDPEGMPHELICFFAIVGTPLNFLVVFFRTFFLDKWNNDNNLAS